MPNPVVHWEILGKDVPGLQSFYTTLFDWKLDPNSPADYGMVDTGEGGLAGGIGATNLMVGHVTFFVEVDDLDAYMKKAESLGGRIMSEPVEVPGMLTYAFISDPEGHLVGLLKSHAQA